VEIFFSQKTQLKVRCKGGVAEGVCAPTHKDGTQKKRLHKRFYLTASALLVAVEAHRSKIGEIYS
jgi:hypothetical protein